MFIDGDGERVCACAPVRVCVCVDVARVMSAGSWSVTERNCPITRPLIVVIAYRVRLMSLSAHANHKLTAASQGRNKLASILGVKSESNPFQESTRSQAPHSSSSEQIITHAVTWQK